MTEIGASSAQLRATLQQRVRDLAFSARQRLTTPGKEATYAAKLEEAKAHLARGSSPGRYVMAESKRSGATSIKAAKVIVQRASEVSDRLAYIDDVEMRCLKGIREAETIKAASLWLREAEGSLE